MRPRHKAAENLRHPASGDLLGHRASMRPRHKAAENVDTVDQLAAAIVSFNEAAA